MNYFSIEFAVFMIAVAVITYLLKGIRERNIFLLAASYLFYGWADPRFLIIILIMSVYVWFFGRGIGRTDSVKKKKVFLTFGVVGCAAALCVFKYFNFFTDTFSQIFKLDVFTLNIILPLGISFYTFKAISYVADVYLGRMKAEESLYKVMLYISFFPQIVSGPIVMAKDFFPQIDKRDGVTKERVIYGIQLIVIGILKKKVIADRLGAVVGAVYGAPDVYSGPSLLVAAIAYSIQLYCDFSGYSDMAIGFAHILGFNVADNFNMPYIAKNPSDFWQRWHISLSSWFRDYVYFPLGGSLNGEAKTYRNLIITMLVSGLWHGAGWTFIVWGALHGISSSIHSFFRKHFGSHFSGRVFSFFSMVLNTCVVWLLWIPFRAPDFTTAFTIIRRIFTMAPGVSYISFYGLLFAFIVMGVHVIARVKYNGDNFVKPTPLSTFGQRFVFISMILIVLSFSYMGDTAFLYAQF